MSGRTILLATDLSCRTDRALDRAVELAKRWGARLKAVHALPDHGSSEHQPSWRRPPDPEALAAKQMRDDLPHGGIDFEAVVGRGEPAALILGLVRDRPCDLILTGVARDEAFGRTVLGSTVTKLTRGTEVPVLVVKSRVRGPYRKVAVATDFSEGSRQALEAALALLPEAAISLYHSVEIAYELLIDDKAAAIADAENNAREEGRKFLADTAGLADAGRAVDIVCEYGPAGPHLREYVQVHGIDLIVVGTEGRSGIAKILLGSTAEKILTASPVDVLVIRRRRHEAAAADREAGSAAEKA